ncbi:hypothetical protein ACM66B_003358 [Microbotryomycetes sp. NB124-2]
MSPLQTPTVNFDDLRDTLEQDQQLRDEIRDAVKQLEQDERQCLTVLQRAHQTPQSQTKDILNQVDSLLSNVRSSLARLAQTIPPHQFYRYNSMFQHALQNASFIIVFHTFLSTSVSSSSMSDDQSGVGEPQIPTRDQVSQRLDLNNNQQDDLSKDKFFLPTEEYLHSLISLLNELSRLAINRVTLGDFDAPVKYSRFAKELSTAFSVLNLKNDSLRKRFDSIKYDVKKLEEIVYDLSLRGLLNTSTTATTRSATDERDDLSSSSATQMNKKVKMDQSL